MLRGKWNCFQQQIILKTFNVCLICQTDISTISTSTRIKQKNNNNNPLAVSKRQGLQSLAPGSFSNEVYSRESSWQKKKRNTQFETDIVKSLHVFDLGNIEPKQTH